MRAGGWSQQPDFSFTVAPVRLLAGKTLGVVGLGAIGAVQDRRGAEIFQDRGARAAVLSGPVAFQMVTMLRPHVIEDRCIGCGLCVTGCPAQAVTLRRKPEDVPGIGH